MKHHLLAWALGSVLVLAPALAAADPTANEKAAAEALFQEGIDLASSGRAGEACAKFDASYQIDPALGTLLRLADCYDRVGRTASAWALFSEAEARAQAQNQTERAEIAHERAANLEVRLSRIKLDVADGHRPQGLEIKLNDVPVPQGSWGTPLPVDPGEQRLSVTAPDHHPWSTSVVIEAGPGVRVVALPKLEAVQQEPPQQSAAGTEPPTTSSSTPMQADTASSTQTVGYVMGAVGIVGLAAAGYFSYRAYDVNDESLDHCSVEDARACTPRGKELRDDAQRSAAFATGAAVLGTALVATGITLVLWQTRSEKQVAGAGYRVTTAVGGDSLELNLTGSF